MSRLLSARVRTVVGGSTAQGNAFGLGAAVAGLVVGWVIGSLLVALWPRAGGAHAHLSNFAQDLCSLCGLWVGLVGGAVAATYAHRHEGDRSAGVTVSRGSFFEDFRNDYGCSIVPVDLPLGIIAGLFGQYVLAFVLELPLLPFVPHLFHRISQPANSLTNGVSGAHYVILAIFVCIGSPLVEELYFRGLLLRSLLGKTRPLGRVAGVAAAIVLSGIVFGLVHFEPLELLALSGFGMLLALLAWSTGRLGAGFVAHVTFNATTFITLAHTH